VVCMCKCMLCLLVRVCLLVFNYHVMIEYSVVLISFSFAIYNDSEIAGMIEVQS
jgi:hypothetical protein